MSYKLSWNVTHHLAKAMFEAESRGWMEEEKTYRVGDIFWLISDSLVEVIKCNKNCVYCKRGCVFVKYAEGKNSLGHYEKEQLTPFYEGANG